MNAHRVYVRSVTDGYSLAAYLLTKLGLLGTVRESYVEVVLREGMSEAVLTTEVERWVKLPIESDLQPG